MKSFSWVGCSSKCPCPGTRDVSRGSWRGSSRKWLSLGQSSAVSCHRNLPSRFHLINKSLLLPIPSGEPGLTGVVQLPKVLNLWTARRPEKFRSWKLSGSLCSAHLNGLEFLCVVCCVFPSSCWAAALLHPQQWVKRLHCLFRAEQKGAQIQCPE